MDAPGLPSFQLMMASKVSIAPVHADFGCGMAAVPDGICWSAPLSQFRTQGAADMVGFANHGLTCLAITA
jgi:hypothetical protein